MLSLLIPPNNKFHIMRFTLIIFHCTNFGVCLDKNDPSLYLSPVGLLFLNLGEVGGGESNFNLATATCIKYTKKKKQWTGFPLRIWNLDYSKMYSIVLFLC